MKLDEIVNNILEDIEITQVENKRLVLHSKTLESMKKTYKKPDSIYTALKYVKEKITRKNTEKKITRKLSKKFNKYIENKIENTDTPEKLTKLKSLETAFNDYHNIKVNNLNLHHNYTIKTNYFKGIPGIMLIAGLGLAVHTTPLVEIIPTTLIAAKCLGYAYAFKKQNKQEINLASSNLEIIKRDIRTISAVYKGARSRNTQEINVNKFKESLINILNSKNEINTELLKECEKKLSKLTKYTGDKVTISKINNYDSKNLSKMKKLADEHIQKYVPTLDLSKIEIIIEKIESGVGGYIKPNEPFKIHISEEVLEFNENKFYNIYAHEVAHSDGVMSEGLANFQGTAVLSSLRDEIPEVEEILYSELLTSSIHTYIVERKKELTKNNLILNHLKNVVTYNSKKVVSIFNNDRPFEIHTKIDKKIVNELKELGAPIGQILNVFMTYESPTLNMQGYYFKRFLNSNSINTYTIDHYKIYKEKTK